MVSLVGLIASGACRRESCAGLTVRWFRHPTRPTRPYIQLPAINHQTLTFGRDIPS